jgi:uncharacterized membrane protein YqiK
VSFEETDRADIQRLIGEVAKRHNLLLPPDDPLFVLLTINRLALNGIIQRVDKTIENAQAQISASAIQQRTAAKAMADQVITSGARQLAEANRTAFAGIQAEVKSALADELAAIKQAGAEAQTARREAWWAALVATGTVCLLIGAVAASWWWQAGDR